MIVGLLLGLLLYALPAHAIIVNSDTYTGSGSDDDPIAFATACTPDVVIIKRQTATNHAHIATSTMTAGEAFQFTNTSATASVLCVKSLTATGFNRGTSSNCNQAASSHYYVALCPNGANDMEVGTYTGNNGDSRDIPMVASWTPELVIIIPEASAPRVWRGATSHSGDSASHISAASADAANHIQSFGAGTFQVGTAMNASAVVYHWIALKGDAAGIATGSFTGNTSDDRDITTGFAQEFVLVKVGTTAAGPSYRFTGMSGDLSFCLSDAQAANQIQALGATTFQVGTDACSNSNGNTMRWFALGDTPEPSSGFYLRRRNQ